MKKRSQPPVLPAPPAVSPYLDPNGVYRIVFSKPVDVPRIAQTRACLIPELVTTALAAIAAAVPRQVTPRGQVAIAQQVGCGVEQSFYVARTRQDRLVWAALAGIPSDWSPPQAAREPDHLPRPLRQVYRLTAALFAAGIRQALNQLHGRYTFQSHIPAIDAAILNAVYHVLLSHPEHLWNITEPARLAVWIASGRPDDAALPPVVGD